MPGLLARLREERDMRLKGGIYHQTQVRLCFNSNRIEGSRLSEAQTRFIYETNSIALEDGETANVDDIIETANHFACFDYMLSVADAPLSEEIIKELHRLLKSGTSDAKKAWFKVGAYKARPNMVGGQETSAPAQAAGDVRELLALYQRKTPLALEDLAAFHQKFERIHPFQDGNGRVGRLILFKECLGSEIMPFIIDEGHKMYYYRGLQEFDQTPEYLVDTFRSAQDDYAALVGYFDGADT
jgi:Fic family protein